MKNLLKNYSRLLQSAVIGFSFAAVGSLHAALPAFDGFDYTTNSDLEDASGGSGWNASPAGDWNVSSLVTAKITNTLVSFTDQAGNVYGGGNSVSFSDGSSTFAADRDFSTLDQSGVDVFFSYVVNITDGVATGDVDSSPFMGVAIIDSAYETAVDNFALITGGRLAARTSNQNAALTGDKLQYGESYLMVGRLSGWNGSSYETTTVWLNPEFSDLTTTDTTITASKTVDGGGADGFQGLIFRTSGLGTSEFNYDDIRVGTTWDAVVIPEPKASGAAVGLVGLSAVMLLRRRQK